MVFGIYFVVDAEYLWKYTHFGYEFSVGAALYHLSDRPAQLKISRLRDSAQAYQFSWIHGPRRDVRVATSRFFQPQVSGISVTPVGQGGTGIFRIDHDRSLQPWKRGPWIGFNWRYDSGVVAGAVPFGVSSNRWMSQDLPDQQFQAGHFCGAVHATPTTPISASGLCRASLYGSTLVQIPARGQKTTSPIRRETFLTLRLDMTTFFMAIVTGGAFGLQSST
jgi:hypothetical protein